MTRAGDTLYAATSTGLLQSATGGKSWRAVDGIEPQSWNFVAAAKSNVAAANFQSAVISFDGGVQWQPMKLPAAIDQVSALAVDGAGAVWVGGRQGIFVSEDKGASWHGIPSLYLWDVSNIFYDQASQRILVVANGKSSVAFEVHLPDHKVRYWNTGWSLRMIRPVGDHLVGATRFDGMVIQPRMVDSSQVAGR
jgi:ligand-binding sensor domain-containing protein